MLGLSFERFVNVCLPHDVKTILSRTNRIMLNGSVAFLIVMIPAMLLIDYFVNQVSFCSHIFDY